MHKIFIFLCLICIQNLSFSFELHRVILATDGNPDYIQFWPLVAKAWKEVVGIQPTLALIADKSVEVDEMLGDVIRFEPIEGVPTSFYAQAIRHLLPAYFENEGCILSDIDMIPLSKDYFINSIKDIPKDAFVVYRDKAYSSNARQYPMCYCAAYGNVFKEVFNISNVDDIPTIIKAWHSFNLGWSTDELLLYHYLNQWNKYQTHCVKLGHGTFPHRRIDRLQWSYNINLIQSKYYIDAHCPRPYNQHKKTIDEIMSNLCNASNEA